MPIKATYTPEQITERLRNAAAASTNTTKAALFLLLFCDIAAMPALAKNLRFHDVYVGNETVPVATVRDWEALRAGLGRGMHGGQECLLTIAESLDKGTPISMGRWLPATGGKAHALALMQAMNIAAGYEEWYDIIPTALHAEHEKFLAELSGPPTT